MTKILFLAFLMAPVAPLAALQGSASASIRPDQLRCEYRVNPLGIDVTQPRLSWALAAANPKARGLKQTAYRVLVASSEAALRTGKGDLWDSGRVESDQSVHVVYNGKPLTSGAQAFWKVQVWDQAGKPSAWSAPALWTMGLLNAADWKGKWIGRDETTLYKSPTSVFRNLEQARWIWYEAGAATNAPAGLRFFRTRFTIPAGRKIRKAICIMGVDSNYELFLNGHRVGRGSFPALPEIFDISAGVRPGENLIAVRANNRKAGKAAGLIGAVRIDFAGGDPLLLTSSAAWKATNNVPKGWEQPGFADSAWPAAKELGPFGMQPWGQVGYIGERVLPARMLRKEFNAPKAVRRATVYASGLGLYELYLNGQKIGDHVLAPNLSDYDKRTFYETFDVTRQVTAGRNAVGVVLGNGRYWAPRPAIPIGTRSFGYPKAIVQLEIEYTDGSKATVASDETWKLTSNGPILGNNEYDGEEYDARKEFPGWNRAGFNDSGWEAARLVSPPAGPLVAQMAEPLRVIENLKPVKITQPRPGVYIFDMGQNMVGWCRLKVAGPKGTEVTLRFAETLKPDGELYVDNLRSARATDIYTLKGGGQEVWEPRFTYHGFRFVEVTGFPGVPGLATLEGRVVHDAMTKTADFTSSNELLNQIHHNIYWGVRGNYRSIPTDCPQRDERQGWLGDRSQVSRSESYLFDVGAFYTKWETDLADSQKPSGSIPDVSPTYWVLYNDDVTWPGTFIFIPGMLYDQYGDRRVIERNYGPMKKWIDYMRGFLKNDLMPKDTYGDWCVPPEDPVLIHSQDPARRTDGTLIGTTYYYKLLKTMAGYARLIGKQQDASDFDALAGRIKVAFHKKFFDSSKGVYGNGTQTSSILPLIFDMAPAENRKTVFDNMIRKIETESKGHVGTGLVGAQWLMRSLSDNGRVDVAYQIATQKTYPGWGYMIQKGATTVWELWNGDTADPAMNSGNHVMQIGDLGIWLYEYLGGIRSDPAQPGFKHAIIRPYPVGDLNFVKASHRSMYGLLATHWKRDAGRLTLDVTVPPNTTATVYVPAKDAASVTESGQPAATASNVKFLRMDAGAAVFEVGSGTYAFASQR